MTEKTPINLVESFERYIASCIDEEGIYPHPCLMLDEKGGLIAAALDLKPDQIFQYFWKSVTVDHCREIIFGLDRTTKTGQGTEFADVLTCCHWREDLDANWARAFRIGVINYQYEPRIVRSIDWGNGFWASLMGDEVRHFTPAFRLKIQSSLGRGE